MSEHTFFHAGPASEMARAAGALLRRHYEHGVATEYKGEVDLVTVADRESEKLLVERLRRKTECANSYAACFASGRSARTLTLVSMANAMESDRTAFA